MLNPFSRASVRLALCILMLLTSATAALAADDKNSPNQPAINLGNDDNSLEVGVWYIQDYSNCGINNLSATKPDALGLVNKLTAASYFPFDPFGWFHYPTPIWSAPLQWGNGNAWENDWKRSALGGGENNQIDTVDLAYFSGHGSSTGFYFGAHNDDCKVTADDAAYSWGNRDNDWIALSACNVLDDPYDSFRYWARAMYGTRLLLGFKTVMSDVDFGAPLGNSVRWGHSFTYAWFKTGDAMLPGYQIQRVLAERSDYFNDKWYNHNDVTDYDNYFSWWTHQVGQNNLPPSVAAAGTDQALTYDKVQGVMPIFLTEPLGLDEAKSQYANIATAFNLTSTTPITPIVGSLAASGIQGLNAINDVFYSDDGDMIMDQSAGNFHYANSDTMWNASAALQAADAQSVQSIDADTARGIANSFLLQNNLLPSDAAFSQVNQDVIVTALDSGRGQGLSAASVNEPLQIMDETVADYQVTYNRVISFTPPALAAAGVNDTVNVAVVGPGAKLMVYVAPSVPASLTASSLVDSAVMGGMGGYRRVSQLMAADTHQPMTAPVLEPATIETVFQKLEKTVALNYIDIPAVSKEVLGHTLSYWEGPIGWSQDQLIPVYVLNVKATLEDHSTQQYDVYLPVNSTYMAPYAKIASPGNDAMIPGQEITLEAADASKTLADLGVDSSLNFALGSGDTYLYDWYVGSIAPENKLGSGRTLTANLPNVSAGEKQGELEIVLVVTDAGTGSGSGHVSTDTITAKFNSVYLPTVQR